MSGWVRYGAVTLAFLAGSTLAAQPSAAGGFPNAEKRLTLSAGDTVTLLNRLVNEGGPAMKPPGRRLDFQYSTSIPVSDSVGRMQQADRAAALLGPQAVVIGVRRISIGICDTRACAERRDPPAMWYLYERTNNGWRRAQ